MSALKIVALPRDPNPYQELLYRPMREQGACVRYGGELTRSRTVNLLALPLELLAYRLAWVLRLSHSLDLHLPVARKPPVQRRATSRQAVVRAGAPNRTMPGVPGRMDGAQSAAP